MEKSLEWHVPSKRFLLKQTLYLSRSSLNRSPQPPSSSTILLLSSLCSDLSLILLPFPFQRLLNKLAESEEEVRSLRERLHDLEEALAGSEAQLHQANLDRNKVRVRVGVV